MASVVFARLSLCFRFPLKFYKATGFLTNLIFNMQWFIRGTKLKHFIANVLDQKKGHRGDIPFIETIETDMP